MDKVSEILERETPEAYQQILKNPPMPPQGSGVKPKRPPIVSAKKSPDEIVADHFDFADLEAMVKFLSDYQKAQADWDTFRRKIPDPLLNKWKNIMNEARSNGYINPRIDQSNIVWKQIVGNPINYDQCSLCPKVYISGLCLGKGKVKAGGYMFVPCWR